MAAPRRLGPGALLGLLTALGAGGIATTWVRIDRAGRRHSAPNPAKGFGTVDAIVVLGAAVRPDGTPCRELERRLEEAAALRVGGVCAPILCCGGHSPLGFSEAAVMRDTLVGLGVPADGVVIDESGTSTRRAVAATRRHVAEARPHVVFVSSGYHMYRILREAERQSINARGHAPAAIGETTGPSAHGLLQKLREVAAVWWYATSGRPR